MARWLRIPRDILGYRRERIRTGTGRPPQGTLKIGIDPLSKVDTKYTFQSSCKICGGLIDKKVAGIFCSKKCYHKHYYRDRHVKKEATCEQCGETFAIKKHSKGLYCSQECRALSRRKILSTKVCGECKKEFLQNAVIQKFCSYRCRITHQTKNKVRPTQYRTCLRCEKSFVVSPGKKYCSDECRHWKPQKVYLDKKICPICKSEFVPWRKDQITCSLACRKKRKCNSAEPQVKRMRVEVGKCEVCGFSNLLALHTHHINNATLNNSKNNLIVLCANCHNIYHGMQKYGYKNEQTTKEAVIDIIKSNSITLTDTNWSLTYDLTG